MGKKAKQDLATYNLRANKVFNRMKRYLKAHRVFKYDDKSNFITVFSMFIEYTKADLGIVNPSKKELKDWAVDLYLNGEVEGISREDGSFYSSKEWRELRLLVFEKYGKSCMRCGKTDSPCVDHIFPRSKFIDLQLDFNNMQVLCLVCNLSKSNRHYTDYRP